MDFSAVQIVFRLLNEIHFGSLALPLSLFYFAVFSVAIKDSCRIFSIFVSVFFGFNLIFKKNKRIHFVSYLVLH